MAEHYYLSRKEGARFGSAKAEGSADRREFSHWFLGPKYMDAVKNRALIDSWETQRLTIRESDFTDLLSDTRGPLMLSERFRDIVESERHPELDTFVWLPATVTDELGDARDYFYAFFPEWPELYLEHSYVTTTGKELKTRSPICEKVTGRAMFRPSNPYDFNLVVSAEVAQRAVDEGCVGVQFGGVRCISEMTGERHPPGSTKLRTLTSRHATASKPTNAGAGTTTHLTATGLVGIIDRVLGPSLTSGQWNQLEEAATAEVASWVARDRKQSMRHVVLEDFESALSESLSSAFERVRARGDVAAMYWEFDPENNWANAVDLCASFDNDDPDWAADSLEWIDGPELPQFAEIYKTHGWADSPEAAASTLVMVARTFAAFGRAYDRAGRIELPFGVSIHDTGLTLMLPRP